MKPDVLSPKRRMLGEKYKILLIMPKSHLPENVVETNLPLENLNVTFVAR
jgi:hypothetical protein